MLEPITLDNVATVQVALQGGRRTELAVITQASQVERSAPRDEEVKERRAIEKLRELADPYYAGAEMFDSVLGMIETATRGLFRQLEPALRQPRTPRTPGARSGGLP